TDAEVVFAIWPRPIDAGWKPGDVIVDVRRGVDEFTAHAIAGADVEAQAASLEKVATSARAGVPESKKVVMRLAKRVMEAW
ncbi:MAG TPA: hypothetical protein VKT52_06680, partial [Ktedonobacterales bacterium]|nr:hypothetical protein [Ktedonobacterales bacterium]